MAPVPNWSNARSQMRSFSGEVVWETQTTCAIVHFGPKPPPTTASRGPQWSRDFGPGRKRLLTERVKDGARPELVQCTVANAIFFRGSGLGNPDHLRHRSLRSEIRTPPPRFRTGTEESSK